MAIIFFFMYSHYSLMWYVDDFHMFGPLQEDLRVRKRPSWSFQKYVLRRFVQFIVLKPLEGMEELFQDWKDFRFRVGLVGFLRVWIDKVLILVCIKKTHLYRPRRFCSGDQLQFALQLLHRLLPACLHVDAREFNDYSIAEGLQENKHNSIFHKFSSILSIFCSYFSHPWLYLRQTKQYLNV